MAIKLADVVLLNPTEDLCAWIDRNIPVAEALPWLSGSWPGPDLNARVEAPAAEMPRELRVNEFYWPNGAQRWAYGAFAASAEQAEQVRAAAHGPGGTQDLPVTLKLDDGLGPETLAVQVHLLRVVPLSSVAPDPIANPKPNNLYLLVVVDARYYWQRVGCPDFGILPYGSYNEAAAGTADVPTPPRWRDLFNKLAGALGATIAVDPISNAYLFPDPAWNMPGAPIPPVLDAMCANVGHRFVALLDGTFATQSADTAIASRKDDDAGPGRKRIPVAGGDAFADTL